MSCRREKTITKNNFKLHSFVIINERLKYMFEKSKKQRDQEEQ